MIEKATQFAAVTQAAADAMVQMGLVADDAAVTMGAAANRANDLADAAAKAGAAGDLAAAGIGEAAKAAAGLAIADTAAAASSTALAGAQDAAGASAARTYGWWMLTGNAIHWIIAGSAELLAVLVPAAVAAGAWAFAWVQGATNVYDHLKSLFTATEALGQASGQTYGQLLGLSGAWQKIQNEANPDVYQALGAAINIVRESFGNLAQTGLQVGQVFDTFLGKVVYDFSAAGQAGSTMGQLLSKMEPDLINVGRFFGDLGAAIGSFAAQMPGLAEVLLAILTNFADLIKIIVELSEHFSIAGVSVLTLAMAFEEFNRWGTLAVGLMGHLGIETTAVSGGFFSMERAISVFTALFTGIALIIPRMVTALGTFIAEFELFPAAVNQAGVSMALFGADAQLAIAALSPFQMLLITVAAVGLGILIDKLVTAQSATQKWAASLQDAAEKASDLNVLTVISGNLDQVSQKTQQTTASMNSLNAANDNAVRSGREGALAYAVQSSAAEALQGTLGDLSSAQQQQYEDASNVVTGANQIAKAFGISVPAAMALAQSANVNLTGSVMNAKGQWTALGEKVNDAYRGFLDMGVPVGAVGQDMLALAIQTGEAGTKMQALNSAWDSFMSTVTGGTAGLGSFINSMTNIGNVVGSVSNNLGQASNISLTTTQFASALNTMGDTGAQAWVNFDQVVGSTAPQLIDWLRTAGTMGATTGKQVQQAGLDMISALIPLASQSATAQSELLDLARDAGLNVTTFPQLEQAVKNSGASVDGLTGIVNTATIALGNMSIDASNLGTVMNNQVVSGISNAALQASGFTTDVQNMEQAEKNHTDVGGKSWQQWAALASQAWQEAQTAAGQGTAAINKDLDSIPSTKTITFILQTVGSVPNLSGAGGAGVAGGGGHTQSGGAAGGLVHGPGTTTSDSVPAWLSRGEYIMNAAAVDHYGTTFMHAMNARKLAAGGSAGITPGLVPAVLEASLSGGGGNTNVALHNHNVMTLDGRRVLSQQRTSQLTYARRNPAANWSLRTR